MALPATLNATKTDRNTGIPADFSFRSSIRCFFDENHFGKTFREVSPHIYIQGALLAGCPKSFWILGNCGGFVRLVRNDAVNSAEVEVLGLKMARRGSQTGHFRGKMA